MNPSPTYIHYRIQWQVLGPESPGQRFEREKFQKFFDHLNADRHFGGYDDFSYRADRCELVKSRGTDARGGQAFSKVVYQADSLSMVEEWTEHSTDEFAQKIKVVLDDWFKCFPETLAVVQSCWVRALVLPIHVVDSRDFVGGAVLGLKPVLCSKLSEPPYKIGFTLGCRRRFGAVPMNLECIATSWRDNRSVWIEVRADTPLEQPLNATKHDQAETVFGRCTGFLKDEILPLLLHYDKGGNDIRPGVA